MEQLNKYTTENITVSMVEENGVAVVYAVWSKNYEAVTTTLACIPMARINSWLETSASHIFIQRKLEHLGMERYKVKCFRRVATQVLAEESDVKRRKTYNISGNEKAFRNLTTGEVVVATNLALFCRERDIPYGSFKKMAQGRNKTSHGWEMVGQD